MRFVSNILRFLTNYTLTFEIPAVKCHHGVEVNWSRYKDTGVTDPALALTLHNLYMEINKDIYFIFITLNFLFGNL